MGTTFGDKLKAVREERNMTQEELAALLNTSKQVISRYEKNARTPKITIALKYAEMLGIPPNFMVDESLPAARNILPLPHTSPIPLLGDIACGKPILAAGNITGYIPRPDAVTADFALRCKGDSMVNARIFDGDIVYIKEQPDVESGEIAAVQIQGMECEATLKRVKKTGDKIILWPENSAYEPLIFSGNEIDSIRILGKAVAFLSGVR